MREIQKNQRLLGQVNIAEIEFDPKSRDDIPKLLKGIQYLYLNPELRQQLFCVLEKMVPKEVDKSNGRPGMNLWRVFVMGMLKIHLDWDFDRLQEMMNNHHTIREMLGHSWEDDKEKYELQTLKDNMELFTPEILDEINQIVVKAGQNLLKKNNEEVVLKGRGDSFVVKTNVHYPTDCNLLFDAMRKVTILTARVSQESGIKGWRKWKSQVKKLKAGCRKTQGRKRNRNETVKGQAKKEGVKKKAVKKYLEIASEQMEKAKTSLIQLRARNEVKREKLEEIEGYWQDAAKFKDQIRRRVLKGETIPQEEKLYSIFERHTEWIVRGKLGVEMELGIRVCIMEDQNGFVLHHEIMQGLTDEKIAKKMVKESQKRYKNFKECSFDKGFHSPENQKKLKKKLELLVLPKKGKLSEAEKAEESREEFVEGRRRHSSVESGINALERHGLNRCRDRGIEHFKRNVALGIVGRNLQKVGVILVKQEEKKLMQQAKRTAA